MNKTSHRLSILLAIGTLFLIFVGGLVNTTDSGLAVPDWPLSYGRLMPPMVGGIFYEHGHRMVATAVGFLTVLLAVLLFFKEDRPWVKKASWVAVGLVIFQGVLGGLTVLLRLPPMVSIAHAFTAQSFFCLTLALAVWTSPFWRNNSLQRMEHAQTIPLHRLGAALVAVCFVQLLIGATLRHTGHALELHIAGALAVTILAGSVIKRIWSEASHIKYLGVIAGGLLSVLLIQLSLGIASFFILTYHFDVIPIPLWAVITVSAHVAIGALFLGLSFIGALIAYRTRPQHSASLQTTLKDYFTLTKPGISFMAGITALAGFVLGSRGNLNFSQLLHTCIGTLMAAAGAGCLNMLIERDLDAKMQRTQTRPLPAGRLQPGEVLFLGIFFSMASVIYLGWAVNFLTAFLAALTLSVYLYVYTPLKKISASCVTAGAVAGALPPVIGWTAATDHISLEAVILFSILFFWQFPHFLSLAWLYKDDYASAGLHMLPQPKEGDPATARQVLWNSAALMVVSLIPTVLGMTGKVYFIAAFLLGAGLLWLSFGFFRSHERIRARRLFLYSLIYIPVLVTLMLINGTSAVRPS